MAKAYWVATYRSISDPEALAGYAKLAGPAIQAAGGRFLARGNAAKAYEAGVIQRIVIIEFDSVEKAAAAHDSEGYQAALKVLGKGADFLRRKGARADSAEIQKELVRSGVLEDGPRDRSRITSYLGRAKAVFDNVRGEGYGLREWRTPSA